MIFPVKVEVGYKDGKAVFYKEGYYDSNNGETPPMGTDAADIADGSWLMDTYSGEVKQYNEHTGAWMDRFTLNGE